MGSLALKSEFVRQFKFFAIWSTSMENVAGEQDLDLQYRFDTNLLTLFKIQTVIKSHSLIPKA